MARIGNFGFPMKKITDRAKNLEYRRCIAVSPARGKIHRVSTSSYAVEIRALFYGFNMAGMLKWLFAELLFGNIGAAIPTLVRNDNSGAMYQVDSANTVTNEQRLNGAPKSNMWR